MDVFMEKIVTKKKDIKDNLITAGIILSTIIVIFISMNIPIIYQMQIGLFIVAGLIYLAYRLITSRNVEYEYVVTNGELDIDKIISRRKRKRIFSSSCKEFDIVARVKSNSFSQSVQSIKNRIDASSSLDSPDAFFATLNYKGEKTLVIFEPDEKMLNNFKFFIARKVLMN
ncbi:MAG: hypothetical protein FIA99_13030 [Ruminiclostridium sp.]|nr:hypothetical protein [Ruminiclostridium sp.]